MIAQNVKRYLELNINWLDIWSVTKKRDHMNVKQIVYKKHQLYHTGERKYLCTTCFQAIECERNFKNHLETHKGERPFSCDKCKKKFSKQSGLTYHMEMVHEGKRNYSCSACNRKVSTRQSLKGHEEKCAIKKKQMREQL